MHTVEKCVRGTAHGASRRLFSLVAASAIAMLAACSAERSTAPAAPTTPDGNYTLTSIAGKALPYIVYSDTGYSVVVTRGTLSLATSRHFDIAINSTETFAGATTPYVDRTSGNWTTTNGSSSVTLTPALGAVIPAIWSGTKLTITQPEGVYQYTRVP
jgi:hypothetical protein